MQSGWSDAKASQKLRTNVKLLPSTIDNARAQSKAEEFEMNVQYQRPEPGNMETGWWVCLYCGVVEAEDDGSKVWGKKRGPESRLRNESCI